MIGTQGKDYRGIKAISNSLMSIYEDDYPSFISYWVYNKALPSKSTGSLTLGSLVDTLLTRPEDYNNMFSVYNGDSPTGQMEAFCRIMATTPYTNPKDIERTAKNAYEIVGFKRDKLDTVIQKFLEYKDFYDALTACKTCVVITKQDDDKAKQKFLELQTNPYTSTIVNCVSIEGEVEVFNQLELTQIEEGIRLKGALDRVVVNHIAKRIYPIDFKTSFDAHQFEESYKKWRYYRQGSFYHHLIDKWAEDNGWEDYDIVPFTFVVCSTTSSKHYLYQMDKSDIHAAKWGGELKDGTQIKGWYSIVEEIRYMSKLGDWTYPYHVVKNKGIVPLKIFKDE